MAIDEAALEEKLLDRDMNHYRRGGQASPRVLQALQGNVIQRPSDEVLGAASSKHVQV
jgi:hypothetical protein